MKLIDWIDLPNLGDERGGLVVAEASKNIPFKVGKYVKLRNDSILYEIKGVEAMLEMNGIKDNIGLVVKKVVKNK